MTARPRETMSRMPPPFEVEITVSVEAGGWRGPDRLEVLVDRTVAAVIAELDLRSPSPTELGVTFTDDAAIRALNAEWRGKDKATNVLSFPAFAEVREGVVPAMLGDIVIAFETVEREAALEGKPFDHHLTHLVTHGFLHLLGYDHESDAEAEEMERVERNVLSALAIPDPYAVTDEG